MENEKSESVNQSLAPGTPNPQRKTEIGYRPADYVVQNLAAESTAGGPPVLETEKMLAVAYAWAQLEVAISSLSGAYETLKGFNKRDLPAKTLKQRMREIRKLSREIVELADRKGAQEGAVEQESKEVNGEREWKSEEAAESERKEEGSPPINNGGDHKDE